MKVSTTQIKGAAMIGTVACVCALVVWIAWNGARKTPRQLGDHPVQIRNGEFVLLDSTVAEETIDVNDLPLNTEVAQNPAGSVERKQVVDTEKEVRALSAMIERFTSLEADLFDAQPELSEVADLIIHGIDWRTRQPELARTLAQGLKDERLRGSDQLKKASGLLRPGVFAELIKSGTWGPMLRDLFENAGYSRFGYTLLSEWDLAAGITPDYPEKMSYLEFESILSERLPHYEITSQNLFALIPNGNRLEQAALEAQSASVPSFYLTKYYFSFIGDELNSLVSSYKSSLHLLGKADTSGSLVPELRKIERYVINRPLTFRLVEKLNDLEIPKF